jgi:hypothetical protein
VEGGPGRAPGPRGRVRPPGPAPLAAAAPRARPAAGARRAPRLVSGQASHRRGGLATGGPGECPHGGTAGAPQRCRAGREGGRGAVAAPPPGPWALSALNPQRALGVKPALEQEPLWPALPPPAAQTKPRGPPPPAFLAPPQRRKARSLTVDMLSRGGGQLLRAGEQGPGTRRADSSPARLAEQSGWSTDFRAPLQSGGELRQSVDAPAQCGRPPGRDRGGPQARARPLGPRTHPARGRQVGQQGRAFGPAGSAPAAPQDRVRGSSEGSEAGLGTPNRSEPHQAPRGGTGLLLTLSAMGSGTTPEVSPEAPATGATPVYCTGVSNTWGPRSKRTGNRPSARSSRRNTNGSHSSRPLEVFFHHFSVGL